MTWPHGDPNAVIKSVLSDGAYGSAAAPSADKAKASILYAAWQWFVEHVLRKLFGPLAHAFAGSREAGTTVGYVLVGLALAALVYVAYRLILALVREPLARAVKKPSGARPLAIEHSAHDWRAIARAAAAAGDYARAIAALFSAALAELDDRAIVPFDASRTPGEYRRLVRRARASSAPPFDVLADRFVRAVYAPERPLPADYDAADRALAELTL